MKSCIKLDNNKRQGRNVATLLDIVFLPRQLFSNSYDQDNTNDAFLVHVAMQ